MQSVGDKETRTEEPETPTDMSVKPSTTESALPQANFRPHSFHTRHKAMGKPRLLLSATDPGELLPMSGIPGVCLPDLDGRAVQDLPVTVPGASRGRAAARGVVRADLPKSLLPVLLQVAVLVVHVLRCELELLDSINFDKSEVKLPRQTWRGRQPISETSLRLCGFSQQGRMVFRRLQATSPPHVTSYRQHVHCPPRSARQLLIPLTSQI